MKILLLGDFSGFHKNLKVGLQRLGCEVVLASTGDGWKKISGDIQLFSPKGGVIEKADVFRKTIGLKECFKGFDVVQMISPVVFPKKFGLNKIMLNSLFNNNKRVFMSCAGATSTTTALADFLEKGFKYPQFYSEIKKVSPDMWSQTKDGRLYNQWLLDKLDGVVPIAYEYAQGFRDIGYQKLKKTLPIPIDLQSIEYRSNVSNDKIVFFHGLNREGDKGTPLIREAMNNIKKRYPNDVEIVLEGKLPLVDYMKLMDSTNVIIDQVYTASYGVNGALGLALGKIVIGGGEQECLREIGLDDSPMVPVAPEVKDIEQKILDILDHREEVSNLGLMSRRFAEEHHEAEKVARQYLKEWGVANS